MTRLWAFDGFGLSVSVGVADEAGYLPVSGSVMVFGCIGIAAITGYLPLARITEIPFDVSPAAHGLEQKAPSLSKIDAHPAVAAVNTLRSPDGNAIAADRAGKADPAQKKSSPQ